MTNAQVASLVGLGLGFLGLVILLVGRLRNRSVDQRSRRISSAALLLASAAVIMPLPMLLGIERGGVRTAAAVLGLLVSGVAVYLLWRARRSGN